MNPDRTIKLELPWKTVQIISAALQEIPFRVASPVLAELQKQIDAQVSDNVVPLPAQGSTPAA